MTSRSTRRKAAPAQEKESGRHRSFKRVAGPVSLVLASIVLAACLGEGALRVIYGSKFGRRPVFGVGDKLLGWKPALNLNDTFYGPDYQIHIRTDADGYRLGALGEVDYAKELVVLLGDSYAFGWGLSTGDTFASQLDASLHRESGGRLRLVNLAVGGYGILQSLDRLLVFLRAHPGARIRTVLVQHCVNDAVDNVRSYGYHAGYWEVEPLAQYRSRSHLFNFIAYAAERFHREERPEVEEVVKRPYDQDIAWSYQRKGQNYPRRGIIGGQEIRLDDASLREAMSIPLITQRQAMTPLQLDLMRGTLNYLHALCAEQGWTVVHTFVATTPQWYVAEVSELARTSAVAFRCRALVTEAIPKESEFGGTIQNAHSGDHYNAGFSLLWAERMTAILHGAGAY